MYFHRCRAETGGCVDFNQPRLQIAVDDDVVPIALNIEENVRKLQKLNVNLVTMAIRDHDWGDGLQTVNDQPVDFVEQLVARLIHESKLL